MPHLDTPDVNPKDGKQRLTKKGIPKVILGYACKAKGIKQVLWERGLWKSGMRFRLSPGDKGYPEMSAQDVLANCQDFREEVGAMEHLIS